MALDPAMPAYRAPLIRVVLDIIRSMHGGEEILAEVDPEHIARIDAAGPTEWLPFSYQIELMRGLYERRGESAIVALTVSSVRQAMSNPLFAALRAGLVTPFAPKPETLLAFVPKGMTLAGRNMGRIVIEPGDEANTANVRWTDLHPDLRLDFVALGHQGSYISILQWGGVENPDAEVDLSDLSQGEARYSLSWLPRKD